MGLVSGEGEGGHRDFLQQRENMKLPKLQGTSGDSFRFSRQRIGLGLDSYTKKLGWWTVDSWIAR